MNIKIEEIRKIESQSWESNVQPMGIPERVKKRKSEIPMTGLNPGPLYVEMLHKYSAFDQLTCTYMSETNEHIFYLPWASYPVC